ncbi:GH3 family acyl-acid amido synthetase [Alkaliphilus crotonatoxidans]
MINLQEMLRQESYDKVWEKYCGFLDLNLQEFMAIQERLLMEQIELLSRCQLGKKIMGEGVKPKNIEEFRQLVPLTTYEDYADILLSKNEAALPSKPQYWIKTTWKGGTHEIKLAPYSESMIEEHTKAFIASLILATSRRKGEFLLRENDKFLYGMAPLPYLTGLAPYGVKNEINFEYLPSIEEAEHLSFEERNKMGFELALTKGIDLFFGLSSVLVKIGEDFAKGSATGKRGSLLSADFKMMYRLIRAFIKKNIKNETILPKDLWDIKGILCAGTDTHAFKEKIEYYWGKRPIEIYGGTEIATVATETWGDSGLTFFPDVNFLEFIPEKDSLKSLNNKEFVPKTLLLNEIKPGQRYELVVTKFRGGAFVRYRVGDMIECLSLQNEAYGIHLPQIKFVDRIANVIDLAGFTRITKATIDKAMGLGKIPIKDWVACKQYEEKEPVLHIYLELEEGVEAGEDVKERLHKSLQESDCDYRDIQMLLGKDPLRVTLLPKGTFEKYQNMYKGPITKMNPCQEIVETLSNCS